LPSAALAGTELDTTSTVIKPIERMDVIRSNFQIADRSGVEYPTDQITVSLRILKRASENYETNSLLGSFGAPR
jgi:hypothetical protein